MAGRCGFCGAIPGLRGSHHRRDCSRHTKKFKPRSAVIGSYWRSDRNGRHDRCEVLGEGSAEVRVQGLEAAASLILVACSGKT